MNVWIPVAGFGPLSALPLAPGSHLIGKSRILRTRAGSAVERRQHRVNSLLDRDASRALAWVRFTGGQAVNVQPGTTRVTADFQRGPGTGFLGGGGHR